MVASDAVLCEFFRAHPLGEKSGFASFVAASSCRDGKLFFNGHAPNSYFASAATDFLRERLLQQRTSFSFETVMSARAKIDLLERAQRAGYRTYLYYVATRDVEINIARVKNRVALGGHPVPEEKIRQRYVRSLALLMDAIRHTDRAYLFDNSETDPNPQPEDIWLAEITGGSDMGIKTSAVPPWLHRAVLDKIAL